MRQGPRADDHREFVAAGVVATLAERPDLRGVLPLADQVDLWVRWSA